MGKLISYLANKSNFIDCRFYVLWS